MAHELTLRKDGKYEMAFVGETPWHGFGQNVTKGASIGVWAKEAGMDWEVLEATPSIIHAIGPKGGPEVHFNGHKALYRSDTLAPLAIMGAEYQVHQPKELLEFFREFTEGGGWHIHTAGTMRGGRKLWVMATCEDAKRYVKGKQDQMVLNLLLATSLDGSMQTTGVLTPTRVVCANTLRAALEGANQGIVKLSHRSSFDAQVIKDALGVEAAHKSFQQFMEQARELAETPISLDDARDVLSNIFKPSEAKQPQLDLSWMGNLGDLGKPQEAPEKADSRSLKRILALFEGEGRGMELPTAQGTRWGLLNAVTEWVDHEMGRTGDSRLDHAWFGRGSSFKQQALQLLTEGV
jgi:phage/plasmid-like protein (TIGR03299 family)